MAEDVKSLAAQMRIFADRHRERTFLVMDDLLGSGGGVLTDSHRSLLSGMLRRLVADIAAVLDATVAGEMGERDSTNAVREPALDRPSADAVFDCLAGHGMLRDLALFDRLHERLLDHVLDTAAGVRGDPRTVLAFPRDDALAVLLGPPTAEIEAALLAYQIDKAKKTGAYGDPLVRLADLTPATAERLCWAVAAAMRELLEGRGDAEADSLDGALERAVRSLLAGPDAPDTGDERTMALIAAVADEGRLRPRLPALLVSVGEVAPFLASLAQLAGIELPLTRRLVFAPDAEGLALICRGVEMERADAASVVGTVHGIQRRLRPVDAESAGAMALYDRVSVEEAQWLLRRWGRSPGMQAAMRRIELPVAANSSPARNG